MRQFLKTSLAFTIGLALVLAVTERFLGWRMAALHGNPGVSPEIYQAIEQASTPSRAVRTVYLGDSVARQLFPSGSETRKDQRFLTCNQACSLAGQYYILQDAVKSFPNLREVYLLYFPGSFENNLGPPLGNDYFCGFFHSPAQMRDIFRVKHDIRMLLVQIGRLILPNVLATNSINQSMAWAIDELRSPTASGAGGSDPEPLMTLLSRFWPTDPPQVLPPLTPEGRLVFLSRISRAYLPKMRQLCSSRGIAFHVLPCPCSDAQTFLDLQHVHDAPIFYRPASQFGDGIHVREEFRLGLREQVESTYHLP
jgi:hypothetical protein